MVYDISYYCNDYSPAPEGPRRGGPPAAQRRLGACSGGSRRRRARRAGPAAPRGGPECDVTCYVVVCDNICYGIVPYCNQRADARKPRAAGPRGRPGPARSRPRGGGGSIDAPRKRASCPLGSRPSEHQPTDTPKTSRLEH